MSATTIAPKLYGVSAFASALLRMWRAWRIILPVVIVNAVLQAVLVLPGLRPYLTIGFALTSVVSFVLLAVSFGLVAMAMLQAAQGPVRPRDVFLGFRARAVPIVLWALVLVLVITLGFALYVVPGFIVMAITPYLLLAVADGRRDPVRTNFRTIGARWGRWIATLVACAVVLLLLWLAMALDGFFIGGPGGVLIAWLGLGVVASWLVCTWALIYRSVNSGS